MPESAVRIGYLDGIRGIAVIAVVLSHVGAGRVSWFEGGFIGVDLFFVLSGYVITRLLIRRRDTYRHFMARRVRRLYPALLGLVVVGGVLTIALPDGPVATPHLGRTSAVVLAQLGSFTRSFGSDVLDPYGHTWSLSVEWVFYAVWPLLLVLLLRCGRRGRRRTALQVAATVAIGIACYTSALLTLTPKAFYFGPLGHCAELLAGAACALLVAQIPQRPRLLPAALLTALGTLALIVITLIATGRWNHNNPSYAHGVLPIATASAVALILVGAWTPFSPVSELLSMRPLQAIGRASYSIYLWHYPILVLIRTRYLPLTTLQCAAVVVVSTTLLSWASYRLLETGGLSRAMTRLRARINAGTEPIPDRAGAALVPAAARVGALLR